MRGFYTMKSLDPKTFREYTDRGYEREEEEAYFFVSDFFSGTASGVSFL